MRAEAGWEAEVGAAGHHVDIDPFLLPPDALKPLPLNNNRPDANYLSVGLVSTPPLVRSHYLTDDAPHCAPTTPAPPLAQWFHAQLSRAEAEARLKGTASRWLVRQSEGSPQHFVLSAKSADHKFQHYKMRGMLGHFFVGGKEFASLGAAVGELLGTLGLGSAPTPVAPPSPPRPLAPRRLIATLAFSGMPQTDELSFTQDDTFAVVEEVREGWVWATNDRTGESGLVPLHLTDDFSSGVDAERFPYFHSQASLSELTGALTEGGVGSFLVRPSQKSEHHYALLVNSGHIINKFPIRRSSDGLHIGGRQFKCLDDIIERYRHTEIADNLRLTHPVLRTGEARNGSEKAAAISSSRRMERLSSHTSCPKALKAGYMQRKTKESGKWRPVYGMLSEAEGQLFIFESEKRTKPKSIYELGYCSVVRVDWSLFCRDWVVSLVLHGLHSGVVFLAAPSEAEFRAWAEGLEGLCGPGAVPRSLGDFLLPPDDSPLRLRTSTHVRLKVPTEMPPLLATFHGIHLEVAQAKDFVWASGGAEAYVLIQLNGAKVAKTVGKPQASSIVWDEEFLLERIQCRRNVVTVSAGLYCRSRSRTKDYYLGSAVVIGSSVAEEGWYPLTREEGEAPLAQLRLWVSSWEVVEMPRSEYASFAQLLPAEDFVAAHHLGRLSRASSDEAQTATALLGAFPALRLPLIAAEVGRELAAATDPRTLFRAPTCATALLAAQLRAEGTSYVVDTLAALIAKVIQLKTVLVIEKSHVDAATAAANATRLAAFATSFCQALAASVDDFPRSLRRVLCVVREKVAAKWPADEQLPLKAVGLFLFLRLICVAIVDPRKFHLTDEAVSEVGCRNLVLVAKLIQSVASFGSDSPDLPPPIPYFLQSQRLVITQYLSAVSSPGETELAADTLPNEGPLEHLATLFTVASSHLDDIDKLGKDSSVMRNLASVVRLLKSHESQYQNPIHSSFLI